MEREEWWQVAGVGGGGGGYSIYSWGSLLGQVRLHIRSEAG